MSNINISALDLRDVVQDYLKEYGMEALDVVFTEIDGVAKESVKRLKSASKQFKGKDYAKGWAKKVEKGRLSSVATVYGRKPTYSIAHLLEYGHVTKNGTGRVFDRTPGHEHIAPVNDWAQTEAVARIKEKLEDLK